MTNYLIVALASIIGMMLYSMYNYFDGLICDLTNKIDHSNVQCQNRLMDVIKDNEGRSDLLRQQCKDGIQNNAICCKSAIDKMRSEISKLNTKVNALKFPQMKEDDAKQ